MNTFDWDRLDFLGWRDPKAARRAYVVVPLESGPVGILLCQAEAAPRTRAQCSWCQDVELPNDVVFYSARRAGPDGRKGDTVGTLVCAGFECSANVRRVPSTASMGFDPDAVRTSRIETLRERATAFAGVVLHGT
ncbi:MAG: FBP domain-containing protein [Microbacteriaceae bacterium]